MVEDVHITCLLQRAIQNNFLQRLNHIPEEMALMKGIMLLEKENEKIMLKDHICFWINSK